jgi:hypothetical protein
MKPIVENKKQKAKTPTAKSKVDTLWKNHTMYSTDPDIKVMSRSYDNQKCKRAKCDISDAIALLYTDGRGKPTGEYITSLGKSQISIQKIGKRNYLSDNGALFKYLNKSRGITKQEYLALLKAVKTDYDLVVMNNELCIEITDPEGLADCYRNMTNVIAKIKCIAN